MSETSGDRPAEASPDAHPGDVQASPEQPYDVPSSAQQYGQPPATGYQPPATDGQSAPVQGQGPQQYGQPEHGQASYAQEGFPAPGPGPGGYEPTTAGYGQPPVSDPTPGREDGPQTPAYEQQPFAGRQPYAQQPSPGQAPYAQQPYPGQAPYAGQQPYGQQPPYPGQAPYAGQQPPYAQQQPYPGQAPFAPQPPHGASAQHPYPGQGYPPQPYVGAAVPMSEGDQRLWATLTPISIPFFGFIGPLVAYLLLKDRSAFLASATTEALNFSILYSIVYVVGIVLTTVVVGGIVILVAGIAALVFCILAAVAANKGEVYRYPLSWRLVK